MTIKAVGVVGCGLMGSGIAQVVAQAGYPTTVVEASQELLDRGLKQIRKTLLGLAERGKLPRSDAEADRKSTRLNSSHNVPSRMPSSA